MSIELAEESVYKRRIEKRGKTLREKSVERFSVGVKIVQVILEANEFPRSGRRLMDGGDYPSALLFGRQSLDENITAIGHGQ